MKKIFACVLSLSVLLLSGCFNPVFESIEKEVELSKGSVAGTINSIVRFDDASASYLVCSNGEFVYFRKCGDVRGTDSSETVWGKGTNDCFSSLAYSYENGKYEGQYIVKTAADDKYVYVLTTEIQDDGDGETTASVYHIYYADTVPEKEGTWKWTEVKDSASHLGSGAAVFCTNDADVSKRTAYLRGNDKKIYKLGEKISSALDASEIKMGDGSTYQDPSEKDAKTVKSVIACDTGVLFFTTLASVKGNGCYFYAADDTTSSTSKTFANTDIYMVKDGAAPVLVYAPRSNSKKNDGKPIMSIAVTDDYLLFGCGDPTDSVIGDGGIYHLSLGKINSESFSDPLSETDSFSTNADAALTQYYEVRSLLVEDPSKPELDACIFASITFKSAGSSISVSYENKGLWAYYPGRGNWNRE